MTEQLSEWKELAQLWQHEDTAVAIDDIRRRMRRDRLHMLAMAGAELLASVLGLVIALWLAIFTSFTHLGWLLTIFIAVSAAVALRLRGGEAASGDNDVLTSLETALARDDRCVGQLQIGRAVGFAALFVVVMVSTTQLRHLGSASLTTWMTLLAGSAYVLATLLWNTVLTRQVRRRRDRLRLWLTANRQPLEKT